MRDFLYERQVAPCGVAVEMIYGADGKSAKVWRLFAMQIFSESDGDYRSIGHMECGAPVLEGIPQRISLSHTSHCMVIASLPKTPDIPLDEVNMRTAVGIDLEKADRAQVLRIRDRYLSSSEKALLPDVVDTEEASEEDIRRHILAWTCKEALYKAVMGSASDWKEDYRIISLPVVAYDMMSAVASKYGKGIVRTPGKDIEMNMSSWEFEGHIVTLAFSGKIARYPV